MADTISFKGFGGVVLHAEADGSPDDPAILLIHGTGQSHEIWRPVAAALVAAGRRVVNLDLRGHGTSEWPADGRYDFDALVEDLRLVLAQLGSRPVIVASTLGGWIATAALARDAAMLAAGLVLVDPATETDAITTRRVGEDLRAAAGPPEAARWDLRILDAINVPEIAERVAAAAPAITVPVLLVRGTLSDLASEAGTAGFISAFPDVECAEVPGARLLVTDQRIDDFNAVLLDFLERRQPRVAPEYRSGSDARTLRDALGCFATGVTIVTAIAPDGTPVGLTANSFTSLSLDPPLLLVCIANGAGSARVLRDAPHFAVNVLQIGQQPASNRFAGKGEDRFAATDWVPGEAGAPVLAGSLGSFECERHAVHDGGDHFILIGRVQKARFEPRRDPLLYFRGKYRRLHFA